MFGTFLLDPSRLRLHACLDGYNGLEFCTCSYYLHGAPHGVSSWPLWAPLLGPRWGPTWGPLGPSLGPWAVGPPWGLTMGPPWGPPWQPHGDPREAPMGLPWDPNGGIHGARGKIFQIGPPCLRASGGWRGRVRSAKTLSQIRGGWGLESDPGEGRVRSGPYRGPMGGRVGGPVGTL